MTIGTGTFSPAGKFAFPRSYVYALKINRYGWTIARTGFRFVLTAHPFTNTIITLQISNSWGLWNSNGRTLDHIVDEFFLLQDGFPPEVPMNYWFKYAIDSTTLKPSVIFDWSAFPDDYQTFSLPGQPLNYWLPPPFP